MQETNIGWCDYTSNVLRYRDPDDNIVHACIKCSPGCGHCYSETLAPRWGRKGRPYTESNMKRLTPFIDEVEAGKVLRSKKLRGKRLFVNDMTDWMGPWVPDELIDEMMVIYLLRSDAVIQTLTKHADRQQQYFCDPLKHERWNEIFNRKYKSFARWLGFWTDSHWPTHVKHIHIGVSAEDQQRANERVPTLRHTSASTRFVSFEPLLGKIEDASHIVGCSCGLNNDFSPPEAHHATCPERFRIHWAIVGAESGSNRRDVDVNAITDLVDRLHPYIPVYVKQDVGLRPGQQGRIPDSHWLKEFPK